MRGPIPTSSQPPPSQPSSASRMESSGQYSFVELLLQKKMLSTLILLGLRLICTSLGRRILTSVLRVSGRDQSEAGIITIDQSQVTS